MCGRGGHGCGAGISRGDRDRAGTAESGRPHICRYQTWQAFAATMGCPALHPQAF
jgi:hypothetical protein